MTTSALPITGAPEVNTGSSAADVASTPSDAAADCGAEDPSCRDVTGTRDPEEQRGHDGVVAVSTVSASAAATGSLPIDAGNGAAASLTTPTSGHEDNGEFRVRFRFDSVSCVDADAEDVASATSALPKEPHPVRDQTVHRRARDDTGLEAGTSQNNNNIRLCLPPPASPSPRRLCRATSDVVKDGGGDDVAATPAPPRTRWLFRRREAGARRRRDKPSSALKKEIKAARQLGVIMGAFTVCFLPYLPSPAASTTAML